MEQQANNAFDWTMLQRVNAGLQMRPSSCTHAPIMPSPLPPMSLDHLTARAPGARAHHKKAATALLLLLPSPRFSEPAESQQPPASNLPADSARAESLQAAVPVLFDRKRSTVRGVPFSREEIGRAAWKASRGCSHMLRACERRHSTRPLRVFGLVITFI